MISTFEIENRDEKKDEIDVVNEKTKKSQLTCDFDDQCWKKWSVKSSIQLDMNSFVECAYFLFKINLIWIDVKYNAYEMKTHEIVDIWFKD